MNKTLNDGGSAFPRSPTNYQEERSNYDTRLDQGASGMSLRDWFAGQALGGMAAGDPWANNFDKHTEWLENVAQIAYLAADAMLAARNKEKV
jgi:hypothetical protein